MGWEEETTDVQLSQGLVDCAGTYHPLGHTVAFSQPCFSRQSPWFTKPSHYLAVWPSNMTVTVSPLVPERYAAGLIDEKPIQSGLLLLGFFFRW